MDLGRLRLTGGRWDARLGEEALKSGGRERHQRLGLFGSDTVAAGALVGC